MPLQRISELAIYGLLITIGLVTFAVIAFYIGRLSDKRATSARKFLTTYTLVAISLTIAVLLYARFITPKVPTMAEELSPTHFRFYYPFEPLRGWRDFAKLPDANIWRETYPNQTTCDFREVGRITNNGNPGLVVEAIPDKGFQIFIPDKNATRTWLQFRHPGQPWGDLNYAVPVN